MKWDDNWIREYLEFKEARFKGNTGIYECMNFNQRDAVKKYFRWASKKLFYKLCKNTALKVNPDKTKTLSNIMGSVQDWIYDGCEDTGYRGGGRCALGHLLRYKHFAVSPSTGALLTFGVNCASDFFIIEADRLRMLVRVQTVILEEIKKILFIGITGKHAEYRKRFYGDLIEVAETMEVHQQSAFGKDWDYFMADFIKCSLPLTDSMIKRYDRVKRQYYLPLKEMERRRRRIQNVFADEELKQKMAAVADQNIHLIRLTVSYLLEHDKNITPEGLKRKNYLMKQAINFYYAYKESDIVNNEAFKTLINKAAINHIYAFECKQDKATGNEKSADTEENIFYKTAYSIGKKKYELLMLLGWCLWGDINMYENSGCEGKNEGELIKLEQSVILVRDLIRWMRESEVFSDDLNKLRDCRLEGGYDKESLTNMAEYVIAQSKSDGTKNRLLNIATDIGKNYLAYGKISHKQRKLLVDVYVKLSEKSEIR